MTYDAQSFRQKREQLGLNQTELARIIGVEPRTVRKWEAVEGTNKRPPNPIACKVLDWMSHPGRPEEWPGAPTREEPDHKKISK